MQLRPLLPLLPRQTILRLLLWHLGIADIQTQDRSCWIRPKEKIYRLQCQSTKVT